MLAYRNVLLAPEEILRFGLLGGSRMADLLEHHMHVHGKRTYRDHGRNIADKAKRGFTRLRRAILKDGASTSAVDWWFGGDDD